MKKHATIMIALTTIYRSVYSFWLDGEPMCNFDFSEQNVRIRYFG